MKTIKKTIFAVMIGLGFAALASAQFQDPNCQSEQPPCSNFVQNGSGCGTIGGSGGGCCAYKEWRCVGTSTTFRQRLMYYGDLCSNLGGGYKCEREQMWDWPMPADPSGPSGA